jgi:predicted nucleic acid-binding protein
MPALVIDASLASAWCFPDEQTEYTKRVLQAIANGADAFAPRIWAYEVRNSVLIGSGRGRISKADAREFLVALNDLPVRLVDPPSYDAVLALAELRLLTFYDAAYLDLALRKGLPLASLDKALCRAAEGSEVRLSDPAAAGE